MRYNLLVVGRDILVYHSRFRLRDRQEVHRRTVEAFQPPATRALAVTTQVCEMSLDLDADVLISELAPIPSLVQRMGRANRHAVPGSDGRADVYLYRPERVAPYSDDDIAAAVEMLGALGTGDISQRDLALALEQFSRGEPSARPEASFLDGGYYAVPGSLRDGDGFTAPCVLSSDLAAIAAGGTDRYTLDRHLPGYEISVPKRCVLDAEKPDWLPGYLGIAPGDMYHPALGFVEGASS